VADAVIILPNRRFKFNKRSPLFLRVRNETFPVVAVRVCNPDRSPAPKGWEKKRLCLEVPKSSLGECNIRARA
jgi:hypothetical protein